MPILSVVMTAYNAEKYIAESIESVISQSHADFEFIIVNDGSTDGTAQIIQKYSDDRIKFINNSRNRGSVPCLRDAINMASGTYVATQDADDISMQNRFQLQLDYFSRNTATFCVGGRSLKIDPNGHLIGEWNFPPENHDDIVKMLVREKKCPIINPTSMFKRSEYLEIGGYSLDAGVVASYDLELWTKAILANKIFGNLRDYLVKYRIHSQSMTQRLKWPQIAAYNKIMVNFIKRVKHVNYAGKKVD